ncbi:cytochrome d ubiquinol oxidase subunit II [Planctomonas sp. JC2975]|uniref:cytochrome d ubiquinol oxidase subunit II n=1 Tax=Planctomonas sp. JC2975 TaxID=2729626 RepID=UPI001474E3DD|nr:cytochrome d ubiquinol oxidase subunit II [Planctomonas sp. JC2975]
MDVLPTLWFILIAVLWTGYLFLEGFDLGVGMHMLLSARNETDRRVMLNTIGPVWDGNEVWLLTAGGATFAAFPFWYASLFSTLYIPLVVAVLGLIFRAVSIEYRGKGHTARWTRAWDVALGVGSFVAAFGVGAALALTTTGLPINSNGDGVGGPFGWFNGWAIVGGLAVVGFCLAHSAAFLALKSDGDVRVRSRRFTVRWMPVLLIPLAVWVLGVELMNGKAYTWILVAIAVAAAVWSWIAARRDREGMTFAGMGAFLVLGAASIFANVFPTVLPSTFDPAFDLTVANASSSPYTLGVMTTVAAFGIPLVLAYQGWTYWVFRKRISGASIPATHAVEAAVKPQ